MNNDDIILALLDAWNNLISHPDFERATKEQLVQIKYLETRIHTMVDHLMQKAQYLS